MFYNPFFCTVSCHLNNDDFQGFTVCVNLMKFGPQHILLCITQFQIVKVCMNCFTCKIPMFFLWSAIVTADRLILMAYFVLFILYPENAKSIQSEISFTEHKKVASPDQ
jgi:hypothetical protein